MEKNFTRVNDPFIGFVIGILIFLALAIAFFGCTPKVEPQETPVTIDSVVVMDTLLITADTTVNDTSNHK